MDSSDEIQVHYDASEMLSIAENALAVMQPRYDYLNTEVETGTTMLERVWANDDPDELDEYLTLGWMIKNLSLIKKSITPHAKTISLSENMYEAVAASIEYTETKEEQS